MQNPIQTLRQSSFIFEKPDILSENLEILTSSRYPTVQYFFAETSHMFPTYQCLQKGVWDFLFYLVLELFAKIKKDLVSTHSFFTLLLITQDLKTQKITHTRMQTLLSRKFSKKVLNSMVVGARQSFFSDKKPGFLEIIEVYLNLGIGFCIT